VARAAVIGEPLRIYGYGLAGALLFPASDQTAVMRAWRDLPGDVAVVLLTSEAAGWLDGELARRPDVLPVVMPEPAWSAPWPVPAETSP
jgi:vacuolar-type H+-ATPase subunit F/Vma7